MSKKQQVEEKRGFFARFKRDKTIYHEGPSFKQRYAKQLNIFWKVWWVGLAITFLVILYQLYKVGQLHILLPNG